MEINLDRAIPLKELNQDQIRWVQQRLAVSGYLRDSDVDGVVGPKTLAAFNAWKSDFFLDQPGVIGPGSVQLLAQCDRPDPVSEQPANGGQRLNPQAGQQSGKSSILPGVGRVWENQWIDPQYPWFTWGELTAGLTRVPNSPILVENARQLVQALGIVRKQYGSAWAITSGYRPPEINKRVGGASRSTHLLFRAADVTPLDRNFRKLVEIARGTPQIRGIGLGQRRGFIHLDIGWQSGDRRREFSY